MVSSCVSARFDCRGRHPQDLGKLGRLDWAVSDKEQAFDGSDQGQRLGRLDQRQLVVRRRQRLCAGLCR